MMKAAELTGKKIGNITVLKRLENDKRGNTRWLCKCKCGTEWAVAGSDLKVIRQCRKCGYKINRPKTHGDSKTRLYRIHHCMLTRCKNANFKEYDHYGGRGIKVCEQWENYINFKEWALNNGYDDTLTIERIDVDGNYEPNNCKWIKREDQIHNRRISRRYEINGEILDMGEISKKYNINYSTLNNRLKRGWNIEKAVNTEVLGRGRYRRE